MLTVGRMLVRDISSGVQANLSVPVDLRAGAKLLARVAQSQGPKDEAQRIHALETLREHADKCEVVGACCIGCGATRGLKRCEKCDKALFFRIACMRQMWPTHKRCCQEWAAQRNREEALNSEDAVDVATLPTKVLKSRLDRFKLDRLKISYAGVLERTEPVALLQNAI